MINWLWLLPAALIGASITMLAVLLVTLALPDDEPAPDFIESTDGHPDA